MGCYDPGWLAAHGVYHVAWAAWCGKFDHWGRNEQLGLTDCYVPAQSVAFSVYASTGTYISEDSGMG